MAQAQANAAVAASSGMQLLQKSAAAAQAAAAVAAAATGGAHMLQASAAPLQPAAPSMHMYQQNVQQVCYKA